MYKSSSSARLSQAKTPTTPPFRSTGLMSHRYALYTRARGGGRWGGRGRFFCFIPFFVVEVLLHLNVALVKYIESLHVCWDTMCIIICVMVGKLEYRRDVCIEYVILHRGRHPKVWHQGYPPDVRAKWRGGYDDVPEVAVGFVLQLPLFEGADDEND